MISKPLYNFTKQEKLKSRKLIELLFKKGDSFLIFPIKVLLMKVDEPIDSPIKIGVSVSSKKFKKAVDRNRIKRLLKENYRLNKQPLHEFVANTHIQIAVFLMYIDKTLPNNSLLQKKMPLIIDKLIKTLSENGKEVN